MGNVSVNIFSCQGFQRCNLRGLASGKREGGFGKGAVGQQAITFFFEWGFWGLQFSEVCFDVEDRTLDLGSI